MPCAIFEEMFAVEIAALFAPLTVAFAPSTVTCVTAPPPCCKTMPTWRPIMLASLFIRTMRLTTASPASTAFDCIGAPKHSTSKVMRGARSLCIA
eukprot:1172042-Prymnesium_polylepis.2